MGTYIFFSNGATAPSGPGPPHYRGFTITHVRHTTLGRTPLDVWSARRRHLYLTTHNSHKRQTSMPTAGFEPAIPASKRPQTHVLDRAATGIGLRVHILHENINQFKALRSAIKTTAPSTTAVLYVLYTSGIQPGVRVPRGYAKTS